jgi:hypothetical protein
MTSWWGICGMVALYLAATPAHADEVLYCVDTGLVGFKWGPNGAAAMPFKGDRFTVKVLPKTEDINTIGLGIRRDRIITQMAGDVAGSSQRYQCVESIFDRRTVCNDLTGTLPWVFHKNAYTRAFLAGPPTGDNTDPNIVVGYGACTKF